MVTVSDLPALRRTLENEDTFATTLLAICLDGYGTECFTWDPETLWSNLQDDFDAKIPRVNCDKIQALITCYTTNMFQVSVETFSQICNVLSGAEADFRVWDMVTPEEAIWGIYEVSLNTGIGLPEGEKPPEFSHEVRRYLGVILKREGISSPPDVLRLAEMDEGLVDAAQWADEPDLFNAVHDKQNKEEAELLNFLGSRLIELIQELGALPFVQRGNESWNKFATAAKETATSLLQRAQQLSAYPA